MSDQPDRIERTLELLLYAPLGIGLFLKETAPTFVNMFVSRGRAEFDRRQGDVRQHVTTARSLGQVTLAFGAPKLRQRVERTVADAQHRAEELFGSAATSAPRPAPASPTATTAPPAPTTKPADTGWTSSQWSPPATPTPAPSTSGDDTMHGGGDIYGRNEHATNGWNSAALPIPGYDALSASQVVERLIGLAPDELASVHEYEASHRQRRTILGKIEQLAG